MKGPISVFIAVLKNWFRGRSGVFFSFMFPLLLLLIFGSIFGASGSTSYSLRVYDGDNSPLSSQFVSSLDSMEALDVENIDTENIIAYAEENPSQRILVIPKGFQENVGKGSFYVKTGISIDTLHMAEDNFGNGLGENIYYFDNILEKLEDQRGFLDRENAQILLLTNLEDTSSQIVRSIVMNFVQSFNNRILDVEDVIYLDTETTPSTEEAGDSDYFLPGILAAFIMTNGVISVTTYTSEFRRNGVLKRMAATPLKKSSWITGNLLLQAVVAFLLALMMIGVGWLVFGIQASVGIYTILLILLGSTAFCGMGIVLGGNIEDSETANAAGSAIGFPMMFLSGAFWPLEMMPGFLQSVAKVLPLYYFHEGLRQTMIFDNVGDAVLPFVILGVLAVIFVALAVKVTKWKEF